MAVLQHLLFLLSLLFTLLSYVVAENSFENTAIVRTIELSGSLVHVRTTFAAKALETGAMIYAFALGKDEAEKTSFLEARLRGNTQPLELQDFGYNSQSCVLFRCVSAASFADQILEMYTFTLLYFPKDSRRMRTSHWSLRQSRPIAHMLGRRAFCRKRRWHLNITQTFLF